MPTAKSPAAGPTNIVPISLLSCVVAVAVISVSNSLGGEPGTQKVSSGITGEVKDAPVAAAPDRIAGRWIAIPQLQKLLDDNSPTPDFEGTLDTFDVQLMPMATFWTDPELRQVEKAMKGLASRQKHEIVATGSFGASIAKRPLAALYGYFMMTQKEGETFLCVLNIDGVTFIPWRLFHIPGKTRKKDLLLVELADFGRKRVVAFQFQSEVP
jgi:hypothetical protein